ncbi:MAG: excalibur calcium-binding domain-containing protein [Rhizobium sp.]|nr:excalibur calcium-binding domain-containing protein [Rhizobium sp.]
MLILILLLLPPEAAEAEAAASDFPLRLAAGRTCKQVASCAEAVELWCSGYRRADGDGDGIPCENICHSRAEVDQIRNAIGC